MRASVDSASPGKAATTKLALIGTLTASDRIRTALEAHGSVVRAAGDDKAHAQCPAHEDHNPSLSVGPRSDGRGVLLHCQAGCRIEDVLAALNLTMADLFDDDRMRDAYRTTATYDYPGGRHVHRKPNKKFAQSGNKQDRTLFRGDRITNAATVYVTEGEKDVLAVEAAGGAAVCSAMGARKAHQADWAACTDKHVIIVADKDESGREHAMQVFRLLGGIATDIRIVEAKQGKDVADHIAAGYCLEELVDTTPSDGMPKVWRARDLAQADQPRWLAKNRLPYAAVTLLIGDEGIGKSLLWVWIIAAVTNGTALPDFGIPARKPQVVFIVVTEDDWRTTVLPRLIVAKVDIDMVRVICTDEDGSGAPIFPRDLQLITDSGETPGAVIVDAWLDTVPAGLSVRDPQQARQALHPFKDLATRTGCAVLLLCHTNRVASANPRDRYGATGELRKKARMTLFAQQDEDGQLVVGPEKMNTAAAIPASTFAVTAVRHFDPTDDHDGTVPLLTYLGESDLTARDHIADAYAARDIGTDTTDVVAWLAAELAAGPRWATDVQTAAEVARHSDAKLRRAKRTLHVKSRRDGTTGPWFWSLPHHQGRPDGAATLTRDAWTSGDLDIDPDDASTSKDVQTMKGESQRPLVSVETIYGDPCMCGKGLARHDTGLCEWCTANNGRAR